MSPLFTNYRVKILLSGILTLLATLQINYLPGWICFVPLFMVVLQSPLKVCFRAGLLFGMVIAIPSFFWMLAGAHRFTGSESIYGLLVYLISSIFLSLYFGVICYGIGALKFKNSQPYSVLLNALLFSVIFVVGEALLMLIASQLPWFGFHSGNPLMDNIYTIQLAAFFGIHGLSFIIVFVNAMLAICIIQKKWKRIFVPFAIVVIYLVMGYFNYQNFTSNVHSSKPVTLAILNGNIAPETKWDDQNGHLLVENLLSLNRRAAKLKPDIALWSESAIPWTYRPDDDLVNEILKSTDSSKTTHVIGINTDYKENEVYKSVYALLPGGKIGGRYDKRILLSFIEQPFAGIIFPFLSSQGYYVKAGQSSQPIHTLFGEAGVMICNESAVPKSAYSMANSGAQFLLNLSNDGWFSDTYIVNLHFYSVRMRAVETRKDIAINSNNGYSGLIKASGEIIMKEKGIDPFVKMVVLAPNSESTLYASMPFLLPLICVGILLTIVVIFLIHSKDGLKFRYQRPS